MYFDRFDICEAYAVYGAGWHAGMGSREYRDMCRAMTILKNGAESPEALSENGRDIYANLVLENQGEPEHAVVCEDVDAFDGTVFLCAAGAYGETRAYVIARSLEDAFEAFVEWLDDNAPGCLSWLDYQEAARELGVPWPAGATPEQEAAVWELAEADMYVVSHTTLKHGDCIPSWELNASEVSDVTEPGEVDRVRCKAWVG